MKDRITQFLSSEGISPAEFADKIGVQRSSVSHVLNGRNYPSASFIQKMLGSYNTLNPRWLLLGEGMMSEVKTATPKPTTLFQFSSENEGQKTIKEDIKPEAQPVKEVNNQLSDNLSDKPNTATDLNRATELNLAQTMSDLVSASVDYKEVERIVLFFKDKTFTAYAPSK